MHNVRNFDIKINKYIQLVMCFQGAIKVIQVQEFPLEYYQVREQVQNNDKPVWLNLFKLNGDPISIWTGYVITVELSTPYGRKKTHDMDEEFLYKNPITNAFQ